MEESVTPTLGLYIILHVHQSHKSLVCIALITDTSACIITGAYYEGGCVSTSK